MSYTEIKANGSTMLGEQPSDIDALIEIITRHPLNRTFERIFIQDLGRDGKRFQGNFLTVSHAFDIRSNDPEIVRRLTLAINTNRRLSGFHAQPSSAKQMRAIRKWRSRS